MTLYSLCRRIVTVITLIVLAAGPARAQDRVLRRAALATKVVRRQARATQRKQLQKRAPECTSKNTRRGNLGGYLCQLKLIEILAGDLDLDSADPSSLKKKLKKRVLLAASAAELGQAIAQFEPVEKPPRYASLRFQGRTLSCRTTGALYDALQNLPAGSFDAALLEKGSGLGPLQGRSLKDSVCMCAQQAGQFAIAASIPPSDTLANEMQRSLYARGCFLDVKGSGSSLVDVKRSTPGAGPGGPALSRSTAGDDARLRSFAKSRSFQLEHCRDRFGNRRQRAVDVNKLKGCVCQVVNRWRFPPTKQATPKLRLTLVKGQASYEVSLEPSGKVTSCAVELEGKLKKK